MLSRRCQKPFWLSRRYVWPYPAKWVLSALDLE
uniref:Uncharacterized protein n=1 Tax=Anguilla anguilla TaxID=7936 RepID=A0A0E9PRF2_ANGAN